MLAILAILFVAPCGWAVEESPTDPAKGKKESPPSTISAKPVENTPVKEPGIQTAKETPKPVTQTDKESGGDYFKANSDNTTDNTTDNTINNRKDDSKAINKVELPDADAISFIKSVMALCFVLGLIFLAAYFYKKLSGIKTSGFRNNRVAIDMVGHMALGEKKFLAIIEIQDKHYFIGITPSTISMLSPLELEFPAPTDSEIPEESNFESIFKKAKILLQQRGKK